MISSSLWLVLAGPAALLAMGLLPNASANARPLPLAGWARNFALFSLATAVVMLGLVLAKGPLHTPATIPGIGLWFDRLSAIMFVLVSFVGTIVVNYSRNYMAGDADHGRFTRLLAMTLGSVLTLIVSGNLIQFIVFWALTSLGLNQLLLFYRDRPAAVLAARKKSISNVVGVACIAGATAAVHSLFGGLDFATIFAGAERIAAAGAPTPPLLHLAAGLLVVAGVLKSAQFPTHGWLIEVMETPTPVSALLHAGIINAGGFLLLRFSDVLMLSVPSMDVLALVGGFTALFGSVVMLTQSSIKVSLAWSTIAQMGFMMFQCGLGAWPAALLHIVAHSLYKAHAFLSSGSVIDIARASWSPSPGGAPHPARLAMAVGVVLGATLAAGTLVGFAPAAQPGVYALGAIMLLGLTHFVTQAFDERPNGFVVVRTLGAAALVAVVYFALQAGIAALMAGTLPPTEALRGPVTLAIIVAVVGGFVALTVCQATFITARTGSGPEWARAFYVHVANGLYVNTLSNRLVLKLWPTGIPARR